LDRVPTLSTPTPSGDGLVFANNNIQTAAALVSSQTDAGTGNIVGGLVLQHLSSGTPAASFGSALTFAAHSSNNTIRNQAQIYGDWNSATDGSQTGRLRLIAIDSVGGREGFRVYANGSAVQVGFFQSNGATKQNITGVTTGTLAQLQAVVRNMLTALANYNQWTDSTT
jgi:hypothetical protein